MSDLEVWGGAECTINRVGNRWIDQMAKSGHDVRLDDLDRFASLGIKVLRFPVLWERLAPQRPDDIDWSWPDSRLERLSRLGVRPIAGLVHHGSGPRYTSLVDPAFPEFLAGYARAVARRYPWIDAFTPINEPLTTARFSGLYGHWYPHARSDHQFVRAVLNQLRGIVLAMRAIRDINPAAQLIQTEDGGQVSGTPALQQQVEFEQHRQWLTNDLLTGRVSRTHPLWNYLLRSGAAESELMFFADPLPPDVIGLNYYLTSDRWLDERIERYPQSRHGGNGLLRYADVEAVRARPDGIQGHEGALLASWHRYALPLAITEVHLHCTRDEQLRWLAESWRAAVAARSRGADVRAVTAWALVGSTDWDSLVTEERGSCECGVFDVRGPAARPTVLAGAVRDLAAGCEPRHPVLSREGWWHRHRRVRLPARPLVLVGARGTLGRAFHEICEARGLDVHALGRGDLDLADPTAVSVMLRTVAPWAVINAAGYVEVDDAESHRDDCWHDNVTLPATLAGACHHAGIPLVTFSSDLVFDGAAGRPYVEEDEPAPRNVYGASKAEAERRVLTRHPDALIVRTSAFFGPWDEYNFAAAVRRALSAGEQFRAPHDVTVSPTYVPDLVNATLDLLMDQARGLWHLANDGAITWADFARLIAVASSLDPAGIVDCPSGDAGGAAVRPPYTALASSRGRLMRSLAPAVADYIAATPAARDPLHVTPCASQ